MVWIAMVPRRLGTLDYGRFVFASSVLAIAVGLGGLGLEVHIARSVARRGDDATLSSAMSLGAALLTASCLVAAGLALPGGRAAVPGLAVGFLFQGVGNLVFGALQGLERPGVRAAADVAAKVVFTVGSILAVTVGGGLGAIGAAFAVGYAAYAGIGVVALQRTRAVRWRPERAAIRPVLRESAPMGGHLAAQAVYYRADSALLTPLRGAAETGVYGAAFRLFDSASVVTTIYGAVASPRLIRAAREDRTEFVGLIRSSVTMMALLGLAAGAALATLASQVLGALYGDAFAAAVTPLRLLAIALALSFPITPLAWALVALDGQKLLARVSASAAFSNVVINLAVIPRYGAAGAAATTVVTEIVVLTGSWLALRMALVAPGSGGSSLGSG